MAIVVCECGCTISEDSGWACCDAHRDVMHAALSAGMAAGLRLSTTSADVEWANDEQIP
jgi:hypothetical protein